MTLAAEPIFCKGVSKRVTKSLGEALHAFCALPTAGPDAAHDYGVVPVTADDVCHSSRHIWRNIACNKWEGPLEAHTQISLTQIDAFCINQDHMDERASQMKGMWETYQKAASVRIWFGAELTQSTDEAPAEPVSASWLNRFLGRTSLAVYGDMPIVLSFIAPTFNNSERKTTSHDGSILGFRPTYAPEWKILQKFLELRRFRRDTETLH